MNVSHAYISAGNYTVELTVTDDYGAADTDRVYVMVMDTVPLPNQPPVANGGPDQSSFVGDAVDFDGSQSYDPDGHIAAYDWDFGDGVYGNGITVSHAYDNPGNHSVVLTVTDDDGSTATDIVLVTILEEEIQNESISLDISKIKLSGPDVVFTHSYSEWELKITVVNLNDSCALNDVVVSDVLPAEIELLNFTLTQGILEVVERGQEGSGATDLTWRVGHLGSPGLLCGPYLAEMVLKIGTKQNPAGKQEFTSPGTYILNEGAFATGINSVTGDAVEAGPTPSITVTAIDMEMMPQNGMLLILTAGPINVATLEEGTSRTIPVEVTAYYGDVHNVSIELVDDGGLEIVVIPIVQDVEEGRIVRFYLEVKAPMLLDDEVSIGITIKMMAVGDEVSSNVEYLDIMVRSRESAWNVDITTTISTIGTVGAAAILAGLIRRRIL